jgi:hypothetical protein
MRCFLLCLLFSPFHSFGSPALALGGASMQDIYDEFNVGYAIALCT